MKIICSGIDLSNALQRVCKVLPEKNLIQTLEGVKIVAKENNFILSATDSEMSIEIVLEAKVIEEGQTVVVGRTFNDILKSLRDSEVELYSDEKMLSIRYGESESKLCCYDINEYPKLQENSNEFNFSINTLDLKDLIEKTIYCTAKDETRPILKGCFFEVKNNYLTAVALDGFRLAKCQKKLISSSSNFEIIVPANYLKELNDLIGDEEECNINVDKKMFSIKLATSKFETKLIEGNYINYHQIIPIAYKTTLNVSKIIILNSLERINALASNDKLKIVKFELNGNNWLILSNSTEYGSVTEKINIEKEGEDIVIAFNVRYCIDMIRRFDSENIKIKFVNDVSAALFECNNYCFGLILPVRMV